MRRSLRKVLVLVLAAAAVAALIYRFHAAPGIRDFRWSAVGKTLSTAHIPLLVLSLAGIYGAYALRALRWQGLSRYLGPSDFPGMYTATLMGFAAIFLLGRAGEPARPLLIARKEKQSVSGSFGIYTMERVLDFAATGALAGSSLLLLPYERLASVSAKTHAALRTAGAAFLAALIVVALLLIYLRIRGAARLARHLAKGPGDAGWRARVAIVLSGFLEGLQAIRRWPDLLLALLYTAAHWILVCATYYWILHSFSGRLGLFTFGDAMLTLTFSLVGSAVQLPGIGGGAQALMFVVFTQTFAVDGERAFAAAMIIWLITFAGCCLIGVPLLIREGWSMGELRKMARQEAAAEEAGEHLRPGSKVLHPEDRR